MGDLTFGEWKNRQDPTRTLKEPKSSFAAWHEKEYGGGSGYAPAAPAVRTDPTISRPTAYAPAADYSYDYDSRVKELEQTKRQATVDMDFNTVNEVDKELKSMREQEGEQTIGDRVGDLIGAASAGTVGAVADTVGTLWELAGGDPLDNPLADIAAADSDRFTQSAKVGLGRAGQFLVDTGIAGTNLLTDAAVNALVPGAGLAATGVRSFGSAVREAEEDGGSTQEKALYGLGSAAAGMVTEKLGNAGLLKSAYGSGLLKAPAIGTLGKLAYSAVSEGGEEFLEGLADPLLKNLTYAPGSVYDDKWLNDTLYDSAVGAALGGLAGAADVGTDKTAQTLAKQENSVPQPETEQEPVRVGRVTTIQRPYTGPTPVQTQTSGVVPEVSDGSIKAAEDKIQRAYQESQADSTRSFKSFLKKFVQETFHRSPGVPVSGMTFQGKPYLVAIGNNVPGKVTSGNVSAERLAVLDALPETVRNAEYVGSGEYVQHSGKERPVIRYDYFETPVQIVRVDDKKGAEQSREDWIVRFDVEVLPGANNYRTHQIVNVDLILPEASLAGPLPAASSDRPSPHT